MPNNILVIGSSGQASSLLSSLHRQGVFEPVGLIDSYRPVGSQIHGLYVMGDIDDLPRLKVSLNAHNLVVAIGDNNARMLLTQRVKDICDDINFPAIIDPSAVVSCDAIISAGTVVLANSQIGAGCTLREGVIVNTMASLDHDSIMESFSSLAPGVITGGAVRIGMRSAVGLGSSVIHKVTIGGDTIVGAGSLVVKDLPDNVVAYGSPARVIRTRVSDEPYL